MDLRQQQIQNDANRNQSIVGKEFYMKSDDGRSFRTVYIKRNPFTGNLQSHISNSVISEVPDGIPELPPQMRTKLISMNNALPYTI